MTWTVASDIARRIKELRTLLGGGKPILQEEFAQRAGVRTSQVSQWERGAQRPSRSRLERWAQREGWPIEMFQDGAPLPSEILAPPGPGAKPVHGDTGQAATDPNQVLARFYEVMADASRRGHPSPPELAMIIQQMHGLAVRRAGEPPPPPRNEGSTPVQSVEDSEVPGW